MCSIYKCTKVPVPFVHLFSLLFFTQSVFNARIAIVNILV